MLTLLAGFVLVVSAFPGREAPRKALAADEGNRRAELIRAAGRLFVDKGYDATTIRDIADAVGMRSGSPFYHFRSKQDMLKAVMIEGLTAALEAQQAAGAGVKDPEEKFRALVQSHLRIILEEDTEFPVLPYEWRALSEESRRPRQSRKGGMQLGLHACSRDCCLFTGIAR